LALLIIAHRGDSANWPENTLPAFRAALDVGADLIELDVQMTRDGEVVVIHDPVLDRTTSGKGKVGERTLAEIRSLSAGYAERFGRQHAGVRVPTLAEALAAMKGRTRVMIEIKRESVTSDAEDGIEARTVSEVQRAGMTEDVALISFERRALLRCRQLAPEITRGHLFHRAAPDEVIAGAREIGSDLVMPEKSMLSEPLREQCRDASLKVATWVVDEPEELRTLLRFDLYGVASNRPGVLLDAIWEGE